MLDSIKKLLKNTTSKDTATISDSIFFKEKDLVRTNVPMMNVAFSGRLDGGFGPGVTMWAGPSKHFKTLFMMVQMRSYLNKYPEAGALLCDTEFGSGLKYFESLGIDPDRVAHCPIKNVEELNSELVKQVDAITREDKIFIGIDSLGNAASSKEVDNAKKEDIKADFTRAKAIKSLFRMITPSLIINDIPLSVVNHTYKEMSTHPREIVGGGTGSYYASDSIFIVGRQQEKDDSELIGFNFIINVEKSRYVREKSKIPITVTFERGISPWSGLFDAAKEAKLVVPAKQGWYNVVNPETGEVGDKSYRRADLDCLEIWGPLIRSKKFQAYITDNYVLSEGELLSDAEVQGVYDEVSTDQG